MKTTEIILVPDSFDSVPIEYTGLFEGATVAFYNREYWEKTYHQVFWPTLVGVDESGFILHVQYGFTGALDHEVVSRFLTSPE